MDKIAVLIPCYNEAKTIGKVIDDFKRILPEAVIYVYDNNSTDDTVDEAVRHHAIVRYEYKQGKGNVVRRMFREVDAQCYVLVDGDDTYSVEKVDIMADMILDGEAEMVIGDRLSSSYFTANTRCFHGFGNTLVRTMINILFKGNVRDAMTGLRVMSYNFVKTFPLTSSGFEIETEMTIHALDKNMLIANYKIDYQDRYAGSSKLNTIPDGIRVLLTIAKFFMLYRPVWFFGILSALLLLVGICIYNTPLSLALILSAAMFFLTGIILNAIQVKSRQDFEYKLILIQHLKNLV